MTPRQNSRKKPRRNSKSNPENLRQELASRLPDMLTTAIESYERITLPPVDADAKSYAALHGAAKAALSHIESLLKLAKWASLEDCSKDEHDNSLAHLIDAAKTAMANKSDTTDDFEGTG